jgi:uncharacterized membrane protein
MEQLQPKKLPAGKVLILLLCLAVIAAWWFETPTGLLSKADAVGYAVCHRIPARSFSVDGRPLPLCARCSGMYLGAVAGIFFLFIRYPRRGGLPGWKASIPFLLLGLAFAGDGFNSYLHLFPGIAGMYQPNNTLRLITGAGMGITISAYLVPAFNQTAWREFDPRQVLTGWRDYAGLMAAGFITASLIFITWSPLRYALAWVSVSGVILILTLVYSVIYMMVFHRDNQAAGWKDLWLALVVGLLTTVAQIGLVDLARFTLTGTWGGFSL